MRALSTLPDLSPPEEEILQQANGSVPALLQLAAAWGYRVACHDHDQVVAAVGAARPCTPEDTQ